MKVAGARSRHVAAEVGGLLKGTTIRDVYVQWERFASMEKARQQSSTSRQRRAMSGVSDTGPSDPDHVRDDVVDDQVRRDAHGARDAGGEDDGEQTEDEQVAQVSCFCFVSGFGKRRNDLSDDT